jgi:excisionase family DNA binding protein
MTTLPTQPPEQAPTQGEVTIEEAARALGVSTATVRRRIRQGRLQAVKAATTTGFVYRIRLPEDAERLAILPTRMEGLRGMEGMVQAFRAELSGLVDLTTTQGRRVEELVRENEQLRAQVLALQAPQPDPAADEPRATAAPAEERPRASWWRRWFQP